MMLTCEIDGYGAPNGLFHLRDRPDMAPGRGEVRVAMEWTSVNPIDCRRRQGYGDRLFRKPRRAGFPIILGCDVSGVVDAVGPGVSSLQLGDPVFGAIAPSKFGTYSSHCIVPATALVRRPQNIKADEAAALPYSFLTAWRGLVEQGRLRSKDHNRRVMIIGASGGVGSLAIQIAHAHGARVIAGASVPNHTLCRNLGAESVFDYQDDQYPQADLIFQCGGGVDEERRGLAALRPGGRFLTTVHPLISLLDRHGLFRGALAATAMIGQRRVTGLAHGTSYGWVLFRSSAAGLKALEKGVRTQQIRPIIGTRFYLSDVAIAHAQQASGISGKIVIACNRRAF